MRLLRPRVTPSYLFGKRKTELNSKFSVRSKRSLSDLRRVAARAGAGLLRVLSHDGLRASRTGQKRVGNVVTEVHLRVGCQRLHLRQLQKRRGEQKLIGLGFACGLICEGKTQVMREVHTKRRAETPYNRQRRSWLARATDALRLTKTKNKTDSSCKRRGRRDGE